MQGLSARIRFASANMILNFASGFRSSRYRVFLNLRRPFTTPKTCSTFARTEAFACSRSLALYLPLLLSLRIWLGRRLILYWIFLPALFLTTVSSGFSAPTYPLSPFPISSRCRRPEVYEPCIQNASDCLSWSGRRQDHASFPCSCGGRRGAHRGINDRSFFQNQAPLHQHGYNLSKQLLLQSMSDQHPNVYPLGIWLLESTPQKSEKARLSMTTPAVPSSDIS